MDQVLNPLLYSRLQRYYGEVEVVSRGRAMSWHLASEPVIGGAPGEIRQIRKVINPGEEYRVRCRLCHDYRPRLHINHRWGVWDEPSRSRNLWLANCFNENCYAEFAAQSQLFERVYAMPRGERKRIEIREGKEALPDELGEIAPPGMLIRLDRLAKKHPRHPALEYLNGRGFDAEKLGRLWHLAYCPHSRYSLANNRIIIPIVYQQQMVGWQARYIGDDVDGVPFNEAQVPKYWTSPGFRRRLISYNFEQACRHQTTVIVEGPADVWNVGPMATGLIGKTMSQEVRKKFIAARRRISHGIVVIALDPKPDPRDVARGKPHPIERLQAELFQGLQGRVVPLYLPEEYDPGSIDRTWFRTLCCEAAARVKLKASFGRPL